MSRTTTALLAALALVAGATGTAMAAVPDDTGVQAVPCTVDYKVQNQWSTGFTAAVTITNNGAAKSSWAAKWSYAGNQQVTNGWNSRITQSGSSVTAANETYNGTLATGGSVSFGFQASYSGTNALPATFTLDGVTCNVDDGGGGPGEPGPGTPGSRVDNPYAGAKVYVNPEWSANAAAEPGGSRISNQPTGVWLDRTAAIAGAGGKMGLRAHLDEALRQKGSGELVVQLVIYNLPGRDCSALASNGELGPTEIDKYKTQYIDPIKAILADSKYAGLRIVTTVEIDSLPNLVTNVGSRPTAVPQCDVMKANGNYIKGVGYALNKLGDVPNVYNYVDAGHHGWLGWDDNFAPSAAIMKEAATAEGATVNDVHGFITNTANYSALKENNFTINDTAGGKSVRESKWVDWNRYVDELSFAQAFRAQAVSAGFNSNVGMLIDTSRNGWGGAARPTGPGATTTVDTYVDGGRYDRRFNTGNWCNQAGAGLGERPKAAPAAGIDAYVWMKPPGESDGASSLIPNDEGKGFDRMCDPTYTGNPRNNNNMSGALGNAPLSGKWFSAQFQQLMQNAYPAL
ncbi:glycoside hydrolase family 6 protein [Streptomyces stelliscabiei]|uniref:glycoside hydrolase family 6 protein n=1 Tax=Streptomyces stelliscabiei TaxID=146820 RepID=UPI0029B04097|nr:glycoside hydrolase family 6 protein [Streptomyces stelliscabiei]MDX2557392.1 glycoside hydrolase family 6 protein [Streptomyces stelliscabiei]MDX2612833.1 glycoside hydrolase family 6 protein [Streptomyces stelliscabiei]MDX2637308.1 glycoside hydrolase family 6 protein [Streptomyces stelliscabiei]MDX2666569.1 glycoside hydrolase family 6 protein [Streptomyces stelliscabiei]MDX2711824.1 glycoside hydrolase family 6 protein [Streptomyces stelliscabiei]